MPLGRILLKSISDSKKLSILHTDGARLLYTWLIPHLDVNGCFSADPTVLKGHVFTRLKKKPSEVGSYLDDLDRVGLIVRYQANGDIFLQVPNFTEKQPALHPEREAKPTIPLPQPAQIIPYSGQTHVEVLTSSHTNQIKGKLNEVNSRVGRNRSDSDRLFEQFWESYPKKIHKEAARRSFVALMRTVDQKEIINGTNGYHDYLKHKRINENFKQEPMNPEKFLTCNRWREYIGFTFKDRL